LYRSTLPKLQTPRQPGKRSIADLPPCGAGIRVTTKAYAKRKRSRRKDSNVFTRTSFGSDHSGRPGQHQSERTEHNNSTCAIAWLGATRRKSEGLSRVSALKSPAYQNHRSG